MATELPVKNHMPHVAIFNNPVHGHVNPTLGTVKELVSRGYRVSYVTSQEFAPIVAFAGGKPVIYQPIKNPYSGLTKNLKYVLLHQAQESLRIYPEMKSAFQEDRPDIIAYDMFCWYGKALAHNWGIPSVLFSSTHVYYDGIEDEWFNETPQQEFLTILEQMLRDNGLHMDIMSFLHKHENTIAYLPRSFQEKVDTTDPSVVFAGPGIVQRLPASGWQPAALNKPIVAISLGTIYNHRPSFFKMCMQAFAGTEWHIVMAIGLTTTPEELGEIPANIEIHRQIPQLEVLPRASVFITHAGMGSTMEAVHFGVPMIAIPQMSEQHTNARRIQHLGLGVYLTDECISAASLLAHTQEVMSNSIYKHNISRLQQEIKRSGGAKAAADVFDKIAGRQP